jgi:ribosome biogenesis GTPase / thiamine phosphate phosphatase
MNSDTSPLSVRQRTELETRFSGCRCGRVSGEGMHLYRVMSGDDELLCRVSGAFRHAAAKKNEYPVTGDWVALRGDGDLIEGVLTREACIGRASAGGTTEQQILAANVDLAFIVAGLDGGRNLTRRGIERYLVMVRESGAVPLLVLNKLDLCADIVGSLQEAEEAAPDVRQLLTSTVTGDGIDELIDSIGPEHTAVMLGPSGVGKSSLINALLGEQRLAEGDTRQSDHRGRHTSTSRSLVLLPGGGSLIDTPGLRELRLWAGEGSLDEVFHDLEYYARNCRFRDCTHQGEPDCAVQKALVDGALSHERYESYLELRKELDYLHRRNDEQARAEEVRRWKQISKSVKRFYKNKKG